MYFDRAISLVCACTSALAEVASGFTHDLFQEGHVLSGGNVPHDVEGRVELDQLLGRVVGHNFVMTQISGQLSKPLWMNARQVGERPH